MTKLLEEKELAEIRSDHERAVECAKTGKWGMTPAAQDIGKLLSHVEALTANGNESFRLAVFHQDRANKAEAERDSLSQRLAAAERDTARYKWLREYGFLIYPEIFNDPEYEALIPEAAFKLDAAIDAALSSQEQKCETCGGDRAITKKTHDSEEFIVDCPDCSPSATSTQKCETCGDTKLVTIKTWPGGIEVDNDDQPCPDCVCYAPKHCNCNKCLAAFAHLRLPSATEK